MKAFLVGLLFLSFVIMLSAVGFLFYPLLILSGIFLRIILGFSFIILCIWLIGKLIIYIWEKLKKQ